MMRPKEGHTGADCVEQKTIITRLPALTGFAQIVNAKILIAENMMILPVSVVCK